jgi:predicted outer membrane repeat protein
MATKLTTAICLALLVGGCSVINSTDDLKFDLGAGDTDCTGNAYQQCGDDDDVHWFDSCDNEGDVAEDCPDSNGGCVDLSATAAECQCDGNWDIATACTECLGNWNEADGCETCINQWIDDNDDCGTCPPNWDASQDCADCLGNWDPFTACEECLAGWSGADCGECRFHVDATSTASDPDGLTWATAFTTVQQGIDAAYASSQLVDPASICQVWVAQGDYHIYVDGPADTVQLSLYVHVFGGFAGTETALDERDWVGNVTVLDGSSEASSTDRVFHVVTGATGGVLDGFTITNGYAGGFGDGEDEGGGMWNDWASPTVRNCLFASNHADEFGGGMFNFDNNGLVENCLFVSNNAGNIGGGIYTNDSDLTITNSNFVSNTAGTDWPCNGGGLHDHDWSSVVLTNSIFWANTPDQICADSESWPVDVSYSLVQDGYPDGDNIITDDPGFANLNDYHLQATSPCIDAGDGNAAPELDYDGNPRVDIAAVTNTGTGTPDYTDIGAYEHQ